MACPLSVWRRLTACFMCLGGWKGVDRLTSPCHLKSIASCSGTPSGLMASCSLIFMIKAHLV
jgi:hypothetical protein